MVTTEYPTPLRVITRMLSNAHIEGACIVSDYSVGSHGYSQIGWQHHDGRRRARLGHRVAWEAAHGTPPQGMTIDHTCRNRRCINTDHLRLLTNVENARDNGQGSKTHCPHGHEYDEANTYVGPTGGRRCRECARQRNHIP